MRRAGRGEIDAPRTCSFVRPWILLAVAAVAAAVMLLRGGHKHDDLNASVVRAVDGDTLVASAGGRRFYVRLLGIDTPETHRPGRPVECSGAEASAQMERLAPPGARRRVGADPPPAQGVRARRPHPARLHPRRHPHVRPAPYPGP